MGGGSPWLCAHSDAQSPRWVVGPQVVRPPRAVSGILLALADGEPQAAVVGNQTGGRVGFFLRVEDFEGTLARLVAAAAEVCVASCRVRALRCARGRERRQIVSPPRVEPYGQVAVFRDVAGNKWDLLGPRPPSAG